MFKIVIAVIAGLNICTIVQLDFNDLLLKRIVSLTFGTNRNSVWCKTN